MYLFEIHLTVNELNNDKINDFENLCQNLGGKAILIELPMGEYTQQPMMTYVKKANNVTEILAEIDTLKPQFFNQGFEIIRTKIEIPADQYDEYITEFPNTKGYFEWHGKVEFYKDNQGLQILRYAVESLDIPAHISKNALKHQQNIRFITYRNYDKNEFYQGIEKIIDKLNRNILGKDYFNLIKQQSEYCIYDDKLTLDDGWAKPFLENTILEKYYSAFPDIDDKEMIRDLCIFEAIIRRTAKLENSPFMLKGSLVTRQYFNSPNDRFPMDIDFVCLTHLPDAQTAREVLDNWLIEITTMPLDDGLHFVDFRENQFWRCIDYAMHDDFPTVMTDIDCYIGNECYRLFLSVSFNLPIPFPPVPLTYKTPTDEFIYPKTTPLSLQIAWKIHQTIVRPRLKDIYDLTYLVKKVDNQQMIDDVIFALLQECEKDNIEIDKVKSFFEYDYQKIFFEYSYHFEKCYFPLLPDSSPGNNKILFEQFKESMQQAGFVLENLTLHYPNLQNEITEMPIQDNIMPNQEPPKNLWQKMVGIFKE
ncbi:nucleotidyl transferase AbiEii/AbiGii toxin family protein [Moraxella oblonga]|uniref:nucleotidyl transferase AbiEii/AbiGii toxin family protein n=1 Tax=Moraxella oblonga TaxID=200413 RepID=UPI0008342D96|nr:nucleotidyl transferase AbiEii/AbiGii toxin family protein [Moraxella oblonga]